ncbi:MAG: glycosyltransferase [bacterium]|nr:glycosyltransferase [bacterium]
MWGMKIVIATGIFPPDIGGPALYSKQLAHLFTKKGIAVSVITYGIPDASSKEFKVFGVSRAWPPVLRQFLYCYDVFMHARGSDAIIAFDSLGAGLPAVIVGKILRKKVLIRLGGDFIWEKYIRQSGNTLTLRDFYDKKLYTSFSVLHWLTRMTLCHTYQTVFTTEFQRQIFLKQYALPEERTTVIGNVFSREKIKDGEIAKENKKIILWAGRFIPLKNIPFLIRVFKKLLQKDTTLVLRLIGDGPEKGAIEKIIASEGLQHVVEIKDGISEGALDEEIKKSYMCVLPSLSEVSPNFALRCVMMRKPIVLTAETGIKEVFPELYYANPLDEDSFFKQCERLLRADEYVAYQHAMDRISYKKSWEGLCDEYAALIYTKKTHSVNVLTIGSDRLLFKEGSDVQKRVEEYGKLFQELHIIVYTKKEDTYANIRLGDNIYVYPTATSTPFSYIWDIYRIARSIFANSSQRWAITTQDPFEFGFAGWLLKLRYRFPLQVQIHTDFLSPYFWKESLKNKIRVLLARFVVPRADHIRVVSERIKQSLKSHVACNMSHVTALPIFVDVKKIQSAKIKIDLHKKYTTHDFIIVVASRLTKEKNVGLVIDAMSDVVKKHPKTLLVIIGDGPEKEKLMVKCQMLHVAGNVVFEPWTSALTSYYKSADAYVLSSNYEGYGRSVIEAMAAHIPIIMTDVGIAGDMLIDELDGSVVPVGDIKGIRDALEFFIQNPEKRRAFADEALKIVDSLKPKAYYEELYKKYIIEMSL